MSFCTALYAYDASGDGELSFASGMRIRVISLPEGDGWMEGELNGKVGFFPASYVEIEETPAGNGDTVFIPPPPPIPVSGTPPDATGAPPPPMRSSTLNIMSGDPGNASASPAPQPTIVPPPPIRGEASHGQLGESESDDELDSLYLGTFADEEGFVYDGADSSGGAFNNQRQAVLTDEEMDNIATLPPVDVDHQNIVEPSSCTWVAREPYLETSISEPDKRKKFAGMKTYKAYTVATPSMGWSVERRLKHFQWLRERLADRYPALPIPVIPIRELQGKFAPREGKRAALASFLEHVCRHPLLSSAPVLKHFLSVDNLRDNKAWKAGKRRYEKDFLNGSMFYRTVLFEGVNPLEPSITNDIDGFLHGLASSHGILSSIDSTASILGAQQSGLAKTYTQMSLQLRELHRQSAADHESLRRAIDALAAAHQGISEHYSHQVASHDHILRMTAWLQTVNKLTISVMRTERKTRVKFLNLQARMAGRLLNSADRIKLETHGGLTNSMTAATIAEIQEIKKQRCADWKLMLRAYLNLQIDTHEGILKDLRQALAAVDQINAPEVDQAVYQYTL